MNLHGMQDLLNALGAYFKVFISPKDNELILRIYHDDLDKIDDFTDTTYNTRGEYIPESII